MIIYTANIGNYDNIAPPITTRDGVEYVCYIDKDTTPPVGWVARPLYPKNGMSPCQTSRLPKMLPHTLFPSCEYSIWHDGSYQLLVDPSYAIDVWLKDTDLALFAHPHRGCVYDEAEICISMGLDNPQIIRAQMLRYRLQGMPANNGLYVGGLLVRRHNTLAMVEFDNLWWQEYLAGSCRDQLSLAYVVWKLGIKPYIIPGDPFCNGYVSYKGHRHG